MTPNYNKGNNVKCHYEINRKNLSRDYPPKSQLRKIKLAELKSSLRNQQTFITAFNKEALNKTAFNKEDVVTEASFLVAWNIASAKQPYSDGEFAKTVADVVAC